VHILGDNALHEKVVLQANSRRLSVENFDGENVDELIKICQIHQYFPHQNFVPYGIISNKIYLYFFYA